MINDYRYVPGFIDQRFYNCKIYKDSVDYIVDRTHLTRLITVQILS